MRRITLFTALFSFLVMTGRAQFSGGVIAGVNFSKHVGPSEVDDSGTELETNRFKNGFHLGARFQYAFTEAFGARGEFLFTQKGSDYGFDGQSYWVFETDKGDLIYSTGTRKTSLRIVQNYLELPLMAYVRIGRLEVSGGGYLAYMVRATGTGELRYSGVSEKGSTIDPFTIALDFNYFNDSFQRTDIDETQPVTVDGIVVQVPVVIGARYEVQVPEDQRLFKRFDYGLISTLALYLNQGLAISFRVNYGLQDITRTDADFSRVNLDENKKLIFRNDFDRNLTLQASIAFNFGG